MVASAETLAQSSRLGNMRAQDGPRDDLRKKSQSLCGKNNGPHSFAARIRDYCPRAVVLLTVYAVHSKCGDSIGGSRRYEELVTEVIVNIVNSPKYKRDCLILRFLIVLLSQTSITSIHNPPSDQEATTA